MKITKKGFLPREKTYMGRCSNCKTEFDFQRKEAVRESHDQRDGNAMIIRCPLPGCGNDVWVQIT